MALNGKFALVTGSSRGIGRGIALKLAAEGVKVGVHYYSNEAAAKDTLASVRRAGSDGVVVQADVTQPEEVQGLFDRMRAEFGALDIFVRFVLAHRSLPTMPDPDVAGGNSGAGIRFRIRRRTTDDR